MKKTKMVLLAATAGAMMLVAGCNRGANEYEGTAKVQPSTTQSQEQLKKQSEATAKQMANMHR